MPISEVKNSCPIVRATHCIFNMEGLLLDTEDITAKACQRVLNGYEKKLDYATRVRCACMDTQQMAQLVVRNFELPITWEEYLILQNNYITDLIVNPQLMPGVQRLLRHFDKHRVPMALVTNYTERVYEMKTRQHAELFGVFKHVVCAGSDPEIRANKPAPDIYLVAANRFCGPPCPRQCLIFEDSPNGVWAANNAKMPVIMVPCERLPCLLTQEATLRLDSLENFKPEKFGLPPYIC